MGHYTGGSQSKPTVHPCPLRWGGCGLLTNSTTDNNESKTTQHDDDCLKLDIEDSEVNLRKSLTLASRRGSRIFLMSSTKEKSEHFGASKVRWDERKRQMVAQAQEQRSQRSVQDDNDKSDLYWTEACEGIARRMVKCLEDSEVAKVSKRELEQQVLSPNESRINIVHVARQARNDKSKNLFQVFRDKENMKSSSPVRRGGTRKSTERRSSRNSRSWRSEGQQKFWRSYNRSRC